MLFGIQKCAFAQDFRTSPSGDVHILHEIKKGAALHLPFQILPFTHSYFGFSNGIFKDKNGFLWVGRPFGVQRFDGYDWQFFDVPFDSKFLTEFRRGKNEQELQNYAWLLHEYTIVEDIRTSENGDIWLTTEGDLFKFNDANQTFELFRSKKFFKEKKVAATDFFKIKPSNNHGLFIYGNTPGLYHYQLETDSLEDFSLGNVVNFWEPADQIMADGIPDFFEDKNGVVWMTGSQGGKGFRLFSFDLTQKQWRKHAFPGRYFEKKRLDWYIAQDFMMWDFCPDSSDSLVWVSGLEMGLECFNKKTNRWQQFYLDLVPGEGQEPRRMGGDAEPWADSLIIQCVDDNFIVFHKKERAFYDMDTLAGIPIKSPCRTFKDPSGNLFITSQFALFELENTEKTAQPLTIWFSKIRAGGVERIAKASHDVPRFTLFEHEKTLEISFFGLPFRMPNLLEYRYKTNEISAGWIEIGQNHSILIKNISGESQIFVQTRQPDGEWSESAVLSFFIEIPFWKKAWFQTFSVVILGGFLYGFYWFGIRRAQREAQFKQQLAEVEMSGLRAQINPQFLANCLAAIHHFLAQNESEKASNYLSKFARLVRQILDNSQTELVTLTSEINTLRLYLQLTELQFDRNFRHFFIISPELEPEEVLIPPLLLHPFLEFILCQPVFLEYQNDGILTLECRHSSQNKKIFCFGYTQKQWSKTQPHAGNFAKSDSSDLQNNRARLHAIRQLYPSKLKFSMLDLLDENSHKIGFQITIELAS
jgi:hypothetical protein